VKIGMIGLGRMGSNMVRRLAKCGHSCVVYDANAAAAQALADVGAVGASSPADMIAKLPSPRVVWIMIPAGAVDSLLATLQPVLRAGDMVVDGGNSNYLDDIRRAKQLKAQGVHYIDAGTSGGVFGLERGYCLMVGGEDDAVRQLEPVLAALASDGKTGGKTAERGYLHVGPSGAGHFVKMVHNGIEYGLMAAYAEGFNILHRIGAAASEKVVDAGDVRNIAVRVDGVFEPAAFEMFVLILHIGSSQIESIAFELGVRFLEGGSNAHAACGRAIGWRRVQHIETQNQANGLRGFGCSFGILDGRFHFVVRRRAGFNLIAQHFARREFHRKMDFGWRG